MSFGERKSSFLNSTALVTLRDYQTDAVDALLQYFADGGRRGLIVAATGTGKSLMLAALARREVLAGRRVLLIAHVQELVEQNVKALLQLWPDAPDRICCGGLGRYDTDQAIIVGTIQTMYRKGFDEIDTVLIDEADMIPRSDSSMYGSLLANLEAVNPDLALGGVTATAYRLDSGSLVRGDDAMFDQIVFDYGIREALADGWLVSLVSRGTANEIDTSKVGKRLGEFKADELERAADDDRLIARTVREIIAQAGDRSRWLAFCTGVNHATHTYEEFERQGIRAGLVLGDTPDGERKRIIADYRAGRITCLVGCNVFTRGFNVPEVDLIAMLRPTLSTSLYVQIAGRGMRPAEGKRNCLLLDFAGNVRRHGPVDRVKPKTVRRGDGEQDGREEEQAWECPKCRTWNTPREWLCAECGYERKAKIEDKADEESDVLAKAGDRWIDVDAMEQPYAHQGPKMVTLRVPFIVGDRRIEEFVPFNAPWDNLQKQARRWWLLMAGNND